MKNETLTYITSILTTFSFFEGHAQLINQGALKVNDGTLVSVFFDYKNTTDGNFINDGEVHIFENWANDGIVSYSNTADGKTFFTGSTEQIIEGLKQSDFQNIIFDNTTTAMPFHLASTLSVGRLADFKNGIVNAEDYDGLVIFKEGAFHTNVSGKSFIDGKTENNIDAPFEFPVGDALHYRPAFYSSNSSERTVYTSEYLYKNATVLYPNTSKEESIVSINDAEYWEIIQDEGTEKIVLSLTLSTSTTPSVFFEDDTETTLAIVRWDAGISKWVNDGGVATDAISGSAYSKLVTSRVNGYGVFTIGRVKKEIPDNELIIYNAISPNGDDFNDSFRIKGIDKYPDNTVEIYNRWGVKVYEAKSYNESTVMFSGYSDGRTTVSRDEKLPAGTYFYILNYNNGTGYVKRIGYLYVDNQ